MKTVKLNNGVEMPALGFGVFQVEDPAQCERCVGDALDVGYRLLDTAASYQNEEAVGRAIKASGVPREEIFVTTKLWIHDIGYEKAHAAFARSMARLQLDTLDLLLIHQPYNDVYGAWRAMQELYKDGCVRAIGVSNFSADRVMDLALNVEIPPAVNQIETHVFHQQTESKRVLDELNIQMEAWGPFAEGRNNFFTHPLLQSIAEKYDKSVAQVALRWLNQRGIVAIPKTVTRSRMEENFQSLDFELTGSEMSAIAELDLPESQFFDHRDPAMVRFLHDASRST